MADINGFEELKCWMKGKELRMKISSLVKTFPKDEKYSLISQIQRAVRSITNNIAEGYGRLHYQENKQFVRIARGSLYEVLDHIIIANEENYISDETLKELRIDIENLGRLINGYISYLDKCSSK